MTMKTMDLWNKVCKTDPRDTKGYKGKGGYSGTAICAQSQRKVATGVFGVFGSEWGLKDDNYTIFNVTDEPRDSVLVYTATFYVKTLGVAFQTTAEVDIWTYFTKKGYWSKNNDVHKKVRTDALTKALSELGFNSDIFEGKFDDNKYVQEAYEDAYKREDEQKKAEKLANRAELKDKSIEYEKCYNWIKDEKDKEKGVLQIEGKYILTPEIRNQLLQEQN